MKLRSLELLPKIEELAGLGSYETDMVTGNWTGSDNFIKIFGLEKKEKYSVTEFQALVHPDDFDEVMAYFNECLTNKIDFNYNYRCVKKDGSIIHVASRSKVFYDAAGAPVRILGIKQDISASKKNEQILEQLNQNNRRKNEVLSVAAHDLKAPLSQLEGVAQILRRFMDSAHHDLVDLHAHICRVANGIIAELIEVAELEDEAYELKVSRTDVNDLILRSAERYKAEAERKGITFKTTFENKCFALINADKFSRVFDNLISNALKFSKGETSIDLMTMATNGGVIVKIRDHGIGVKKEYIPLLFEKFSKVVRRKGTMGEHSTGLGLSIVKQIIDLHKGKITVDSEENKGTTFTIELNR